jgi:DNA-binding SARP family transcriptional activator/streptogramin lyase
VRGVRLHALVALLVIDANRVVSVDRLIEEIWRTAPPAGALKVLQNHVHRLRTAMRCGAPDREWSDRIETRPGGYVLRIERGELDSESFEARTVEARRALEDNDPRAAAETLRAALAMWRGQPFEQVAYEDFALGEIDRLGELRLAATEDLIDADLALDGSEHLVPQLRQLVLAHPTRERLHGQLMRALYAGGRQTEALRAYTDARRILQHDAGLDPGPDLQRIHRAVLDHELPVGDRRERPPLDAAPLRSAPKRRRIVWLLGGLVAAATAAGVITAVVRDSPTPAPILAANTLAGIDPETGEIDIVHPVGDTPRSVATDGTAVWVANFGAQTITRLDPASGTTQSTGTGGVLTALATGPEGVWAISSFSGELRRLDPATTSTRARLQLQAGLADIQTGHGSVWITNTEQGTLTKVDPPSARVEQVINGLGGPNGLTVDSDHVWLADTFGKRLLAIDPSTGQVAREIESALAPGAIAYGAGSIWATHPLDNLVTRFDLATREQTLIPVGRSPTRIAADDTTTWVVNDLDHTVTRIDADTGTARATLEFNSDPTNTRAVLSPADVDIGVDHVWITVQSIYPDAEEPN